MQATTSQILPNIDAMHSDIRRLATNLDIRMHGLQQMFSSTDDQRQENGVKHLKEFIQSAATVLSSGSTVFSNDQRNDQFEDVDDFRSDFGVWFRTEVNSSTLDWIYSTNRSASIFEFTEVQESSTKYQQQRNTQILPSLPGQKSDLAASDVSSQQSIDKANEDEHPGSGTDLVPAFPIQQRISSLNTTTVSIPTVSLAKNKRRSLVRLFLRKRLIDEAPKRENANLTPKPLPTSRLIRKKFVFVGDGAWARRAFSCVSPPLFPDHEIPF